MSMVRFWPEFISFRLTSYGRGHLDVYPTAEAIWKIGRYIEITTPPITTPKKIIKNGSRREVKLDTAISTSSSQNSAILDSMESNAPVDSPTEIIWMTIGGKRALRFKGSAMVSPSRMLALAFIMAISMALFPEVLETILNHSKMGTPLLTRVPNVRENRATAIFLNKGPNTGKLKRRRSTTAFPLSVL